jgi:hypothetical protein
MDREELIQEIARSHAMCDLPDNWDDQVSLAPQEATWKRATDWLLAEYDRFARFHFAHAGMFAVPRIHPGPERSIDLEWNGVCAVLMNIPEDENENATFAGTMRIGEQTRKEISGQIAVGAPLDWLIFWMMDTAEALEAKS